MGALPTSRAAHEGASAFETGLIRLLPHYPDGPSVAAELTGQKTDSVYRLYAMTDEDALAEGVEKLARLHGSSSESGEGRTAIPLDEAREAGS